MQLESRIFFFVATLVGASAIAEPFKGANLVQHGGLTGHLINLLQSIDAEDSGVQTNINVTVGADLLRSALKDVEEEAGDGLDHDALENLVTSLGSIKANASKATPGMMKFVKKVTDMIDNDLAVKVKAAHRQTQKVATALINNFNSCKRAKTNADVTIGKLKRTSYKSSRDHKACRRVESRKWLAKTTALNLLRAKKNLMDSMKRALDQIRRKYGGPSKEADKCHPGSQPWTYPKGSAYYESWLASGFKFFSGREKTWFKQKLRWQKAKADHDRYRPIALRIEADWKKKKIACYGIQKTLEGSTCGAAKLMFSSCDQRYWGCYTESLQMHKETSPFLLKQAKDRKVEWRALMRIKCLLAVFGEGDTDASVIDQCKRKRHSTRHLNLNLPGPPAPVKCGSVPSTPCSQAFHIKEYKHLPGKARAGKCSHCTVFTKGFPKKPVYWFQAKNYHPNSKCWMNRGSGPTKKCGLWQGGTRPWLDYETGNGAARKVLAVKGTFQTMLNFGNVIPGRYTICSLTRYSGAKRGRILTGLPNWLHGHWAGRAGVAYYRGWKSSSSRQNDVKANTDWLAMCGRNGGSLPGNIMSNGKFKGLRGGGPRPGWMGVNKWPRNEASDFSIAEIVIFQEQLDNQGMTKVMNYLLSKLKKKGKPGPDRSFRQKAATCTAPQLSKLDPGQRDRRTFRCNDGTCIPRKGMCNGYKNCKDGSDETICKRLLIKPNKRFKKPARSCTIKQRLKLRPGMGDLRTFRCFDGTCTHITGKCNGFRNCGDGSDEKMCQKVKRRAKAKAKPDVTRMLLKYTTRWPHCTNLYCFRGSLVKAKETCAKHKLCDGFSFTRSKLRGGVGGGCYKRNCKVESVRGFGHGSHGYVAKYVKKSIAKCSNLLVKYPVWNFKHSRGVDVSPYINGIKWIGCVGNGCNKNDFFCKETKNSIEFGSKRVNAVLRSLYGDDVPNKFRGCSSSNNRDQISNAFVEDDVADTMCKKMGYNAGKISQRLNHWNGCPYVGLKKGDKKKGSTDKFEPVWKVVKPKLMPATKIKCWGVPDGSLSQAEKLGLKLVSSWTDTENPIANCRSQIPKNPWAQCKKKGADKIAVEVAYKSGYYGFAYYTGLKAKWGKRFPSLYPKLAKGFFKQDPSGPLYKLDYKSSITGTYYPMAWRGLSNVWSRNYDLTTMVKKCNDAKANKRGWGWMKVKFYC